jgi:hypothetical protein
MLKTSACLRRPLFVKRETDHEDHRVRAMRDISCAISAAFPREEFHGSHFTGIEEFCYAGQRWGQVSILFEKNSLSPFLSPQPWTSISQ